MNERRVGIWLIGACGGVGTTAALGLAALKRGLRDGTGLVTELPLFAGLDLDPASHFEVGGHDIRRTDLVQSAQEMHRRADIFSPELIAACRADLEKWSGNVRPGTVLNSGPAISRMADLPEAQKSDHPRAVVERIQADLRAFRDSQRLDQVVVVNVASTEPPYAPGPEFAGIASFQAFLEKRQAVLPASALYAWAALDLGLPYVNFTPSLGASFPAALELARHKKTLTTGKDGKTGETLMKTVLAPMFAHRNLRVLSWVGHNIFGNRDGQVLDDPTNKASKIQTKDQVISGITGYKPATLVTIEYIESMDDWKTAWDHIHFRGFLGTKMILQFIWQGCDSILAAPLVLDLARLTLHAQRRGETGVPAYLSCFFKSPMGTDEHDFFKQWAMLEDYVHTLAR